jgi:hypothetical protein
VSLTGYWDELGGYMLIEQPATLNAAEWKSLVEIAKAKKVLLMEGMIYMYDISDEVDDQPFGPGSIPTWSLFRKHFTTTKWSAMSLPSTPIYPWTLSVDDRIPIGSWRLS